MPSINHLMTRGNTVLASRDVDANGSDNVMDLMITLVGVAFLALLLTTLLIILRKQRLRRRMLNEDTLPEYEDVKHGDNCNPRRLTITTADGRSSIVVVNGKPMLADPNSPPHSPNNVPQIHITFPDEYDQFGHRQNGQKMVVRVGESSVGLEPVREEQLPAYERESSHGFYSVDMDTIGGLKEKEFK